MGAPIILRNRFLTATVAGILAVVAVINLYTPHADALGPYAVTNLVFTPGYQSITITWDPPPPHADGLRHTGNSFGIRIGDESRDRDEDWSFDEGRTFVYTEYNHKTAGFKCDGVDHTGVKNLCNGTTYQIKIWSHFETTGDEGGGEVHDTGWIDVTVGGDQPVVRVNTVTNLTAPGAPTNVDVTPGVNKLDVEWDAPSSGSNNYPTDYIVQWKSGSQGYSTNRQANTGTLTAHTITNLVGGRQYQVRVRAENNAGGTWSGSVNGIPLSGPTVTDVEVTSFTDTVANVTVTLTNPESTSQTVNLRYRTPRGSGSWVTATAIDTTTTTQDFTLSSLSTNSGYEVQASLDSNFQIGVRSASFVTHGAPSNLRLRLAPGNELLEASWTVDLNGGVVSSQVLEWKESTDSSFNSLNPAPNDTARSHTITNLTNGTEYTVKITVTTNYGTESSDEVKRIPAAGPSVNDITFTNIDRTSATAVVSVINTQLANGTVTAYLRHRVKGTTEWSTAASQTVSSTTASFSLTGLTGNTMYEVEASLTSDFQNTVARDLQTAASPPGPPESVETTHGDAELKIDWSVPSNDGGEEITRYVIQWKSGEEDYSDSRKLQTEADQTSATITDLINGTEYTLRMYAVNSLGNGTPVEVTATPSTIPGWPPTDLTVSACDRSLILSWKPSKDTGGSPILAFVIQWKSGTQDYDASSRQSIQEAASSFFALSDLQNDVEYTLRVAAANINNYDADNNVLVDTLSWSAEESGTAATGPCLVDLSFGNPLAKSVPAYVTTEDAPAGTTVYLRYRPAISGSWIATLTGTTEAGDDTVTIDITGLMPSTMYEVEASLDSGFARDGSTIRAFFTTGEMAENWHSGGGGSLARILRIEPGITSVTTQPGSQVALWVDVFGRQGVADNALADRAPSSGRPIFMWLSGFQGSFSEADFNPEWQNGEPDDRQVIFNVPNAPGTYQIQAKLPSTGDCLGPQADETVAEAKARCSADFVVRVKRESSVGVVSEPPANPQGTIPSTIRALNSETYDVFTPEEGGTTYVNGASVSLEPGSVADGEYIGLKITPIGPVSNDGRTEQDYTLVGTKYGVIVVDSSGLSIGSYRFRKPAKVCLPLPDELRDKLSRVGLFAINENGEMILLASGISIGKTGIVVCGGISVVPATVAVGFPGTLPSEPISEDVTPETGGFAPTRLILLIAASLGLMAAFLGLSLGRNGRSSCGSSTRRG